MTRIRLPKSRPASTVAEIPAASNTQTKLTIPVLGLTGSGKSSLLSAMAALRPVARWEISDSIPREAGAVLYLCDAILEPAVLDEALQQFTEQLQTAAVERGRRCEVGDLPVFVVLSKCDLLAQPGDSHSNWLERIEACKLQISQRLQALSPAEPTGDPSPERLPTPRGFGTVAIHFWATALKRPPLANDPLASDEPLGVVELYHQAVLAARAYARQQARQGPRTQALFWGLSTLLISMVVLAVILARGRQPLLPATPVTEEALLQAKDWSARAQAILSDAHRLLRFEGYRNVIAGTDWPRWYQDASRVAKDMDEVKQEPQADKAVAAQMAAIAENLRQIQRRAAILGLAGPDSDLPAVFQIPADFTVSAAQSRLDDVRKHYPGLQTNSLPEEIPLAVAYELRATAEANYEKLLEPAQEMVANRLRELSPGGRETPEAWKKLAEGWLGNQAERDLAAWRELAILVKHLTALALREHSDDAAGHAADPLVQLATFLHQERFYLPLHRVDIQLPEVLEADGQSVIGLRPDGPLLINHQTAAGAETSIRLDPAPEKTGASRERNRYTFAARSSLLVFQPGDQLSAKLKLTDAKGDKWLLTWPTSESRSRVYSFGVLTQAPRLHAESQTDPAKGMIAFKVRLLLSQRELFELPDLFPR